MRKYANVPMEIAISSDLVRIEPIQIVLGNADDAEYAELADFLFSLKNILSAFICARLRHLRSLMQMDILYWHIISYS